MLPIGATASGLCAWVIPAWCLPWPALLPGRPPRYVQSTGCCTLPNYTPRASGRRALFHHTYGALLFEIDVDGEGYVAWSDDELNVIVGYRDNASAYAYTLTAITPELVEADDVVVGITTSGNSPNILKALAKAREIGAVTVGLTGRTGGQMKDWCDICIRIPADVTARIQEAHLLVEHMVCQRLEE